MYSLPIVSLYLVVQIIMKNSAVGMVAVLQEAQKQFIGKTQTKNHRDAMEKKYDYKFDVYLCPWCGKHHIGRSIYENK